MRIIKTKFKSCHLYGKRSEVKRDEEEFSSTFHFSAQYISVVLKDQG